MNNDTANFQKYLSQMALIKRRQEVIYNIFSKRASTGYLYSDIEICVLEIRKIIELIAMASMVSNINKYSIIYDKYRDQWNARLIFRDIERINPDFYPQPIDIDKSGKYDNFIPVSTDFLTKDDAIKLYEKCNSFLHEDNPFKPSHDVMYYKKNIPIWNGKIIRLLNRHIVQIYNDNMYFVTMKSEINGYPSGNIFVKVP